jgi:cobyrinic acid a,c-diamide synthase
MIENKIRKKQIFSIHDKLLKKFLIVDIFGTINRDDSEKIKTLLLLLQKRSKKEKKNIKLEMKMNINNIVYWQNSNKNKYEFF